MTVLEYVPYAAVEAIGPAVQAVASVVGIDNDALTT